jgi:hypothetical protein
MLHPDVPCLSKVASDFDVRILGAGWYEEVLAYLKDIWQDSGVNLVALSDRTPGATFMGIVRSHTHVNIDGLRYGAASSNSGHSARFAYMDDRIPIQIERIIHAREPPVQNAPLAADFAIVRRFVQDDDMPEFPWDIWYVFITFMPWLSHSHHLLGPASWV